MSATASLNIHDRARQMVQQARGTLELSEAYARLSRRGARSRKGNALAKQHAIEQARLRMPYID
jgi:hypothetical protein